MKIVAKYAGPFGWIAFDEDSYEPGALIGSGYTALAAINDFKENHPELVEEEEDPNWDEDQYLDDPRHGQASGINRDNRGRG